MGQGPKRAATATEKLPPFACAIERINSRFFFHKRRMHWKGELMIDGILMLQKALDCRFVGEECGWVVLEVPFRSAPLGLCPLRRSLGFRTMTAKVR